MLRVGAPGIGVGPGQPGHRMPHEAGGHGFLPWRVADAEAHIHACLQGQEHEQRHQHEECDLDFHRWPLGSSWSGRAQKIGNPPPDFECLLFSAVCLMDIGLP